MQTSSRKSPSFDIGQSESTQDAPVVCVRNVSKRYRLGVGRGSLRESLGTLPRRLLGTSKEPGVDENELWALKDVDFAVQRGEALGIIGPNGAGKTTALKLLAGVTRPTSGTIEVSGKLSALIELGAGFHPDLTGRENVYLNGAILGLSKREIDVLFDEIVDFAGLERFIDTPVKRYSSGMYVRLGFAVAAHTSPQVLLVDEVLAVGDASFRSKCYDRIRRLRENGTTVILVSHDMTQVKNLADRAVLLVGGRVREQGNVDAVIKAYHEIAYQGDLRSLPDQDLRPFDGNVEKSRPPIEIKEVRLLNNDGTRTDNFATGETLRVEIQYHAHEAVLEPAFGVSIHALDGAFLTGSNTKISGYPIGRLEGQGTIEFVIPELMLVPGRYLIGVVIHDRFMGSHDRRDQSYRFQVIDGPTTAGMFYSPHSWDLKPNVLYWTSATAGKVGE